MTACSPHAYDTIAFSGTIAAGETDTIIAAAAAANRSITIVYCRIVQGADTGAVIVLEADGDPILTVDPVTFEGVLENHPVNGRAITVDCTGTGSAYYSGSYRVN